MLCLLEIEQPSPFCLALRKVADHEDVNKMSPTNLAVCFAPTLLRPEVETVDTMTSSNPKIVIATIIEEYDFLFRVHFSVFFF